MASGAAEDATMCYGGTVMHNDFTICVGTIGSGIWRSPDGGETWTRVRPSRYPENDVRALVVHPRDPHIVYAGTDSGVYRSEDHGARWERLDAPMNAMHTWALAIWPGPRCAWRSSAHPGVPSAPRGPHSDTRQSRCRRTRCAGLGGAPPAPGHRSPGSDWAGPGSRSPHHPGSARSPT